MPRKSLTQALRFTQGKYTDALRGIDRSAATIRDLQAKKIRGLNPQIAAGMATIADKREQARKTYNEWTGKIADIMTKQMGLDLQIDKQYRQGRHDALIARHKDVAKYYEGVVKALTGASELGMWAAKNLNQESYNENFLNILAQMNEYGIGIKYKDGKPYLHKFDT